MEERHIHTGSHGDYFWLTSTEDYSGTLLRLRPEIVVNQYVAVTSVDGGVVRLVEAQRSRGWRSRRGVAYSPKILTAEEIPHQYDGPDVVGYDEFYVFAEPCDLGERTQGNVFTEEFAPAPGRVIVFVNWGSFVLHEPGPAQALVSLFWPQLMRLQPESYVADEDKCLTFVSRKQNLVNRLQEQLAAQP